MDRLTERVFVFNGTSFMQIKAYHNDLCGETCRKQDDKTGCKGCPIKMAIDKLAEYEDLEEQGKILKLPVAVGDTVYTNCSMRGWYFRDKDRPYEAKVCFIGINGNENYMNVVLKDDNMLSFKFSEIGESVFLTREEAEVALQKMNEKGDKG